MENERRTQVCESGRMWRTGGRQEHAEVVGREMGEGRTMKTVAGLEEPEISFINSVLVATEYATKAPHGLQALACAMMSPTLTLPASTKSQPVAWMFESKKNRFL